MKLFPPKQRYRYMMTKTKLFPILMLTSLLLALLPRPAHACSCFYDSEISDEERVQGYLNDSSIAFVGTLESQVRLPEEDVELNFVVENVFKGDVDTYTTILTAPDSAQCGVYFAEGARVLIFANEYDSGAYFAGLCGGSGENPSAEMISYLGDGYAPTANEPPVPPVTTVQLPITSILLGVLLLVGLLVSGTLYLRSRD